MSKYNELCALLAIKQVYKSEVFQDFVCINDDIFIDWDGRIGGAEHDWIKSLAKEIKKLSIVDI